jgi:hypothetical protein
VCGRVIEGLAGLQGQEPGKEFEEALRTELQSEAVFRCGLHEGERGVRGLEGRQVALSG